MTNHAPEIPGAQNAEAPKADGADSVPPSRSTIHLEWTEDGRSRRVRVPDTGGLLLGRDPERCDLVFDHGTVSREHARILRFEGTTLLQHMSRSNPTWLNGRLVMGEAELVPGDQVQLAIVAIEIVDSAAEPKPEQEPRPKPRQEQEQDEWP